MKHQCPLSAFDMCYLLQIFNWPYLWIQQWYEIKGLSENLCFNSNEVLFSFNSKSLTSLIKGGLCLFEFNLVSILFFHFYSSFRLVR